MTGGSRVVGVIDDDASVRGALRRLFRSAGFDVSLFGSAEEYLDDRCRPEVGCLVIDVRLPGMSGLDLLEQLQAVNVVPLKVVMITAHDDEKVRRRALAAGADAFLVKPFDNQELKAVVLQI